MAGLEDDIPPLEDMTEELEKLHGKRGSPQHSSHHASKPNTSTQQQTRAKNSKTETFGGFKKGFLFSSTSKPTDSTVRPSEAHKESMPHIKKSNKPDLEIPEVQEAMKEKFPFLENQDWVTDDLLSKVESHPNLSRAFQDPHLSQVLLEFQKDPQKAMEAAKDNKEMRTFLQDFCSLMGDHFNKLADQDEEAQASRQAAPSITEVKESPEEDQVREVLARPGVKELLQDKDIQKLIHLLKTNPEAAHRMSASADLALQGKIQQLIDHGLLGMQLH